MRHGYHPDDLRDTRHIGRNNLNQLVHQHLGSDSFMVVAQVYKSLPVLKTIYDTLPHIDTLVRIEPSLKELAVHTPELSVITQSLPALKELHRYLPQLIQNGEYIREFISNFHLYEAHVLALPQIVEKINQMESSIELISTTLCDQVRGSKIPDDLQDDTQDDTQNTGD